MKNEDSLLWLLYGPPLIFLFCILHFLICTVLGLLYNEEKCCNIYEYYAPWGWGKKK